ncbi:hypothetical protein BDR26DRAFT_874526 [Obelidium mucronatum]|nr:hypothetical protein BDR26DRAFT_874526 [Obelidium mucronatum]
MKSPQVNDIPNELLTEILLWISPRKVFKFRRVSKLFNAVLCTAHYAKRSISFYRKDLETIEDSSDVESDEAYLYRDEDKEAQNARLQQEHNDWMDLITRRLMFMRSPPQFQYAFAREFLKARPYLIWDFEDAKNVCDNMSIPAAIECLEAVTELFITCVTASIPKEIGRLSSLERLSLCCNTLSGTIPDEIGRLAQLCELNLNTNCLSGTIPDALATLLCLQNLNLGRNQLHGPIPSWIGDMHALTTLDLSSNKLTGEIPESMGRLKNLKTLYLHSNQLTGDVPTSLAIETLTHIYLGNNMLTGQIPSEVQALKYLKYFDVQGNTNVTCSFDCPTLKL